MQPCNCTGSHTVPCVSFSNDDLMFWYKGLHTVLTCFESARMLIISHYYDRDEVMQTFRKFSAEIPETITEDEWWLYDTLGPIEINLIQF